MARVASWKGTNGAFEISRTGEKVACVAMSGIVDASGAQVLEQTLQRLFDAGVIHAFWDMSEVINYHAEIRVRATHVLAANRKHLSSIEVLTSSRIVEMGVAVANLALKGMIKVHRTRQAFDTARQLASRS